MEEKMNWERWNKERKMEELWLQMKCNEGMNKIMNRERERERKRERKREREIWWMEDNYYYPLFLILIPFSIHHSFFLYFPSFPIPLTSVFQLLIPTPFPHFFLLLSLLSFLPYLPYLISLYFPLTLFPLDTRLRGICTTLSEYSWVRATDKMDY